MHVTNTNVTPTPMIAARSCGLVRRLWHAISPNWVRELRLAASRCYCFLPKRSERWRFLTRALINRFFRRSKPLLLKSSRLRSPIAVRPFSSDLAVAVEMFVANDYQTVRILAGTPTTILDLGANIGLSVRLWQEWYPNARVVAVEPNAQSAAIARQNIDAGSQPHAVTLVEAAVSPAAGVVHLSVDDQPWMHTTVDRPAVATIPVRAITVPDCLAMIGPSERIDLCKCDIEGGEAKLFHDCSAWIERIGVLVIETHDPYDVESLQRDLERNGSTLKLHERSQRGMYSIAYFVRQGSGSYSN